MQRKRRTAPGRLAGNERAGPCGARENEEPGVCITGVAIFLTDRVNINEGAEIAAGGA